MKNYMYLGKNEERRTKAILAPKMKQREHSRINQSKEGE
jgi:hypothetical protein